MTFSSLHVNLILAVEKSQFDRLEESDCGSETHSEDSREVGFAQQREGRAVDALLEERLEGKWREKLVY